MARILVVDDEYQIRLSIRTVLKKAGYDVTEALDGEECVARFREHPFDLVVLDIMLPKKDGLEVIQDLVQEFPDVKIITISGAEQVGKVHLLPESVQLGALRAVAKPFNPSFLLSVVQECLSE